MGMYVKRYMWIITIHNPPPKIVFVLDIRRIKRLYFFSVICDSTVVSIEFVYQTTTTTTQSPCLLLLLTFLRLMWWSHMWWNILRSKHAAEWCPVYFVDVKNKVWASNYRNLYDWIPRRPTWYSVIQACVYLSPIHVVSCFDQVLYIYRMAFKCSSITYIWYRL